MRKAYRFVGERPDLHLLEIGADEPPPKGWKLVPPEGVIDDMHKYLRKRKARAALAKATGTEG